MVSVDQQAHRNLCEYLRFAARLDRGSVLLDEDGIVASIGPSDFPSGRVAVRSSPSPSAADFAAKVDSAFAAHGKTGCAFTRVGPDDDDTNELLAHGFAQYSDMPEMVCDHVLDDRSPGPGITVRLADSPDDVRAYAAVAAEAFGHIGFPPELSRVALDNPDVVLTPECAVTVAELDGRIVAGAMTVMVGHEPNAYVAWVACADEARGRGLGDLVTRGVTNEAFARGAHLVSLEASRFGEHTYERMGYREIYRYRLLIRL